MAESFSRYDKRYYKTLKPSEGYKLWSSIYDSIMTDDLDIILLEELATVSWSKFGTAADLACGTGRIGMWLREKRHIETIDGVDISQEMLAHADKKSIYRRLYQENILAMSLPANSYSLVISSFAVCHIKELNKLYMEVDRILEPGGCFILVDYHPFFLLNGIPTHFTNTDGSDIAIENWVHLISDYISQGINQKFQLLEMKERIVTEEWAKRAPTMAKFITLPVSFVMVWKKPL